MDRTQLAPSNLTFFEEGCAVGMGPERRAFEQFFELRLSSGTEVSIWRKWKMTSTSVSQAEFDKLHTR